MKRLVIEFDRQNETSAISNLFTPIEIAGLLSEIQELKHLEVTFDVISDDCTVFNVGGNDYRIFNLSRT